MATKKAAKKQSPKPEKPKAKVIKGAKADPDSPLNKGSDKPVDAPVPDLPADAHSEAIFAAEAENKEFGVVEDDLTAPLSASIITAQAWNESRGDDPEFKDCVKTHQDKLLSHAQAVINGGPAMQGDSAFARFEQRVAELNK